MADTRLIRLSNEWDDAVNSVLFINRLLIMLRPGARILDFGCGAGATVFRLRELGFEAYGFDIHDYVNYRSDTDRQWFRFSRSTSADSSAFTVDADRYRVPFPDSSFDVVHSSSVLEHVLDLDPVLAECARLLNRQGICVHFYPGRYQLVEPHLYVPLASFIIAPAWVRFWIALGARNEHQGSKTDREIASSYAQYIATGLRYRSQRTLRRLASTHFERVRFPPKSFVWPQATLGLRARQFWNALTSQDRYRKLALCGRLSAMVCDRRRLYPVDHPRSALWKAPR